MNIPDRYQKSYNLFASMFSKCSSLQQWVGRVRDETIAKDLADVKKEFHEKYYELKEERMSLIKIKVKETLGIELEVYFGKPAMMLVVGYTFTGVSGFYVEFLFVMHSFLNWCVIEKEILLKIITMATVRIERAKKTYCARAIKTRIKCNCSHRQKRPLCFQSTCNFSLHFGSFRYLYCLLSEL